jgi:hypothetical protein
MQSWFANNLTWVNDNDTPADGTGICGTWNDRYMEVLWTIRANRITAVWSSSISYSTNDIVTYSGRTYKALSGNTNKIPSSNPTIWSLVVNPTTTWSSSTSYVIGQTVFYTPSSFSTYEQTGEIYKAKTNNTNKNPESNPSDWQLIPHTDNNYYNEYTISYDEKWNGFSTFYSFKPRIYLKWNDTFFTAQPIPNFNRIYIHDKGSYTSWYTGGATSQIVDGYIEGVVNSQPDTVKWFEANRFNTEIAPQRVDYATKTQISFLTTGEFTSREGNFDSPIKMDSTGQVVNDAQTSRLYGKFLKVKMTFLSGVYQRLFDVIVKFRNSVRLPQK